MIQRIQQRSSVMPLASGIFFIFIMPYLSLLSRKALLTFSLGAYCILGPSIVAHDYKIYDPL